MREEERGGRMVREEGKGGREEGKGAREEGGGRKGGRVGERE